ncbi:hypothetical protein HDU93_006540 [Gonapodya sp. JEL0774]|nr:hypothetical protein HDU93_006540 [Gonapodya sp. JEL0774]
MSNIAVIEDAAGYVFEHSVRKVPPSLAEFPYTLSNSDAYEVAKVVAAMRYSSDGKIVGYKIALNPPQRQVLLGVPALIGGFIFEHRVRTSSPGSPAQLSLDSYKLPGIELEVVVRVGKTLKGQVTLEVTSVHAGFEVIDNRYGPTIFTQAKQTTPTALIADGLPTALVHGSGSAQGKSADPLNNLLALVHELDKYGLAVEEGHYVMTGATTDPPVFPFPPTRGVKVAGTIEGVGHVEAVFE